MKRLLLLILLASVSACGDQIPEQASFTLDSARAEALAVAWVAENADELHGDEFVRRMWERPDSAWFVEIVSPSGEIGPDYGHGVTRSMILHPVLVSRHEGAWIARDFLTLGGSGR